MTPFRATNPGADDRGMETSRDEKRLWDVQWQIEMLYLNRGDDFNLPARYEALVKLERILLEKVNAPSTRRERESVAVG